MADRSPGLFDVDARLAEISAKGDGLERVAALVDFELFRPTLEAAVPRRDRSRGGRPPFDHVLMLKVLILALGDASAIEGGCDFLASNRWKRERQEVIVGHGWREMADRIG